MLSVSGLLGTVRFVLPLLLHFTCVFLLCWSVIESWFSVFAPSLLVLFTHFLPLSVSLFCFVLVWFGFLREQGLQDKIKLLPLDLQNRPGWYKDKVYPPNKVRLRP